MEPNEFGHAEIDENGESSDGGSPTESDEETTTDDHSPSVEQFTEIVYEQRRRQH